MVDDEQVRIAVPYLPQPLLVGVVAGGALKVDGPQTDVLAAHLPGFHVAGAHEIEDAAVVLALDHAVDQGGD
ncbi:MAG: hypothetical protein WC120_05190 [Parcubacteria group bacterium]